MNKDVLIIIIHIWSEQKTKEIHRCTNMNQHDILMTAVTDVSKGQTYMSYIGELQTLTKLNIRHKVCPGENCWTTISDSIITTMLMSRGRSNCGVKYYASICY